MSLENKVVIITCFAYNGIDKWCLKPEYLQSDLARVISYCINYMGCSPRNIFVLTDLDKHWLAPIIDQSHVVSVKNACHYDHCLKEILKDIDTDTRLLFYYTGHGGERYLMIPNGYFVDNYRGILDIFLETHPKEIVAVFDCCYAQSIINNMCWYNETKVVLISSACEHQTCGFFSSTEDKGSLFTCFFFEHLKKNHCRSIEGLKKIESRINEYRWRYGKPRQNISFVMSDKFVNLPLWLVSSFS